MRSRDPELYNDGSLTSLDTLTDYNGWYGYGATICRDMIGFTDNSGCMLISPALSLNHADSFNLYLKGVGTEGDVLQIAVGDKKYGVNCNGEVDLTCTIPYSGDATRIYLSSYNGIAFMFDEIKVMQNVAKGDTIFTFSSSQEVDAEQTSHTFSQLDSTCDGNYAFSVYALLEIDGESTISEMSNRLPVALTTSGNNLTMINTQPVNNDINAIYSLQGQLVDTPSTGIYIIRKTDGKITKKLIR